MNFPGARVVLPCTLLASALLALAVAPLPTQEAGSSTLVALRSDSELASYLRQISLARLRREQARAVCKEYPIVSVDSSAPEVGDAVLRGSVYEQPYANRAGIRGAQIYISSFNLGATTDAQGRFELRVPTERLASPESVTVRVRRIGYLPASFPLTLRRGMVVKLDVPLCQSPVRLESVVTTEIAGESPSVTNDQVAGVDEGGIVKRHGDHLVILHRGRIFTVDVSRGQLRRVDMADASGPEISGGDSWYDELLVSGDRVVVIGYSYRRGGLEIGIFHVSDSGKLQYLDTYNLQSNDYYSSRNYSSRLIGSRLIVYSPLLVRADTAHPLTMLPSMGRWQPGAAPQAGAPRGNGHFRRVAMGIRAYRPAGRVDLESLEMMHTITSCDLAAPELKCESTLFFGGDARSLFVSRSAVYLASELDYVADSAREDSARARVEPASLLYRVPLGDHSPSAIRIAGMPLDQFSFHERDGELDVLLRSRRYGDEMWAPERPGGELALLRLPLARFGDGTAAAPRSAYQPLPALDFTRSVLDRFVSGQLLYGDGNPWAQPDTLPSTLLVVSLSSGDTTRLTVPYSISRIDALGRDAVVVGSDTASLYFTAVRLGQSPELTQRYTIRDAAEGETRSHGFYYVPDDGDGDSGTFGLPVARPGRGGHEQLDDVSEALIFVRAEHGAFHPLGELAASADRDEDDACKSSCLDWYGNARPLFVGDRIFALLGYEVVEGELRDGRIVEKRRISFAPRAN
ncbi:MAG TPA: beta-propeller domain-containing protein [Gemmatimonadaceae bacterium]